MDVRDERVRESPHLTSGAARRLRRNRTRAYTMVDIAMIVEVTESAGMPTYAWLS